MKKSETHSRGRFAKVMKFGASSVGTPERINGIIEIVNAEYAKGRQLELAFSAFQGVTDQLIQMSKLAAQGNVLPGG